MDDFTSNNPDSQDGDFKALLARRKNRKMKSPEQEEKLMKKTKNKFIENKNMKALRSLVQRDTAVDMEDAKGTVDYVQMRTEAFQHVQAGDLNALKTTFDAVGNQSEILDQFQQPKSDETLLHRALSRVVVNMDIVRFLVLTLSEKQICACQQVTVGGKKSLLSVLHVATEHSHVEAVKLVVGRLTDKQTLTDLLYKTTVIVPEGQRPRPMTCLHIAAKAGNNELVTFFIKNCGMPVNLANDKGDLPILWAANDNRVSTVELLVSLGADVNGQNDKGSSALHWACRNGHTDVVKALLTDESKVNVDIERHLGLVCPIIAAAAMGFGEIVKLLIQHKAQVNKKMKSGHTALHFAAVEGHLDIVSTLLDAGAVIDELDDHGNTALLLAASHGHNKLVVIFLVKCGSNFNHRNLDGKGVWDFALEQKNAKLVMALVDNVATAAEDTDRSGTIPTWPTARSSSSKKLVLPPGITLLHAAASIGYNEIIQFLLDKNIDPYVRDDDESTFIHVAAKQNRAETLQIFATEQHCQKQDYRGYTPLHIACEHACNEAIAIILPLSNLSQTNIHKQTALHLAARATNVLVKHSKLLVTQMILRHDWTVVHLQDVNSRSALHSAVLARNTAIIAELNHLSPNLRDANGTTPIHIAIMNGDHEMLDQLISTFSTVGRTMDLNQADSAGDTPLHLAAKHGHEKMIKTLITCGADLEMLNAAGRTVLHELALLISEHQGNQLEYMAVFDAVCETSILWWCRRKRKSVPNAQANDNVEYKRQVLLHLFTDVYEPNGFNVLEYATTVAAAEMVIAIINTQDVFRFSTSQSATVKYDVTNLFPFTSIQKDGDARKPTKLGNSSVSPLDNKSHMYIDDTNTNSLSIAKLLTEVKDHKQVASILDTSPFKNIVDLYWNEYQLRFLLFFLIHIFSMTIFSFGMKSLKCSTSTTSTNETLASLNITGTNETLASPNITGTNKTLASLNITGTNETLASPNITGTNETPANLDLRLYSTLNSWPLILLVYDLYQFTRFIIKCIRSGARKTMHSLYDDGENVLGFVILEFCGFLYSTMTICWFALTFHCNSNHDYILSLAYIFGWVYAISFTRGLKSTHHFYIMLQHILFRDILRFALIYLFILLGFSFAYGALVQAIPSLKLSAGASIFTVFNWMIGMADFETDGDEFDAMKKSENMVRIVYSVYVILSTIVLLNLLIAMMNDSYAGVRQMSEVRWKIGKLTIPLDFKFKVAKRVYRRIFEKRLHLHIDINANRWYISIPKKELAEPKASSDAVIHDLTMKVDRLIEESRVRESRIQALLQSKDDQSSGKSDEK